MFAVLQRKVERLKAALTSTHSIMFGNASPRSLFKVSLYVYRSLLMYIGLF